MSREKRVRYCRHCNNELSGRGPRKFCSDECRDVARKVSKSLSNQAYYEALWDPQNEAALEHHRAENRLSRSESYYGLTKPKLRSLFERAEAPQEEYPHRDDFLEYVAKKIMGIPLRISHPLADLPSVAATARVELGGLRNSLDEKQGDSGPDSTIAQLRLAILAIERDIGRQNSAKALGHISGMAKKVQKLMHAHNELYGFIHALLVRVEILRIQYFATTHRQFLVEALTWLKDAEDVCDQALVRLPIERKQLTGFLRCYVDLARVRLAFDADELDDIDTHIQAAHDRVAKFADAYGTAPVVTTGRFISLMNHAERQLGLTKYDRSSEYVAEAEHILPQEHRSIESQHRIAIIKTHIALAHKRPDREMCMHDYLSLLDRNPCLEYRHGLRELKDRYKKNVPNVDLLTRKDNSLFVDTTFTHIYPFVTPIGALKGVGGEVSPRAEESEVMLSAY